MDEQEYQHQLKRLEKQRAAMVPMPTHVSTEKQRAAMAPIPTHVSTEKQEAVRKAMLDGAIKMQRGN